MENAPRNYVDLESAEYLAWVAFSTEFFFY